MIASNPSRGQLLTWIGQLTNTAVEKIQHLSDGLHFCEVFDKIYPRNINLHKLKRDPKVPLEKEKNFRILLNAINKLGLSVRFNIMELSLGKVTALLELLQWFYKLYKNPIGKLASADERDQNFNDEPRMIKSYVGNLIIRQKSCHKENEPTSHQLGSSRRSLDSKLLQKNVFQSEEVKTVKSKSIRKSQNLKESSKSKAKSSRMKNMSLNKEAFAQASNQKRESMKKTLQQRRSSMKKEAKEESIHDILQNALNYDRPKLQRTLIKITQAVLENNPELEAKIKMLLQSGEEKKRNRPNCNLSPDSQVKSILASYLGTSENCQNDTLDSGFEVEKNQQSVISLYPIQIEKCQPIERNQFNETDQRNQMNQPYEKQQQREEKSHMTYELTGKKQTKKDQKETVKKSAMKSEKEKASINLLMSQHSINQISAQKQRVQRDPYNTLTNLDQRKQEHNIYSIPDLNIQESIFSKPDQNIQENCIFLIPVQYKQQNLFSKPDQNQQENNIFSIPVQNRQESIFSKPGQQNHESKMKMSRFHVSPLYNPVNPETYVTEKKVEAKVESRSNENPREVQSEKLQVNLDENVWKPNQSFGPYPHLP